MSKGNSRFKGLFEVNVQTEDKLGEQKDITSAKETYAGFMSMLKWGTIVVVISALSVLLIIASRA